VDVLAGGEVHDRVGTPQRGPAELLDFLLDRRGDRRVADVGVDLYVKVPADDHRLELGMVDVGGNDCAPAGHLAAHELGRHPLTESDKLHLGGRFTAAGEVELGDGLMRAVD
jgi:hypothetical protein